MHYPEPISKLIDSFMKLPGIGPKTAQRLAFHTLDMKEDDVVKFAKALVDVKRELTYCSVCGHITENDPCYICEDKQRDRSVICVVEDDNIKVYITCFMVRFHQWMVLGLKTSIYLH